jgi:DNA-directed RNA polymerase II subunit RPB1
MDIHMQSKQNTSKIVGIQFGIMSPEEILKGSVVEVTKKDTFINTNKPVINGLFDPRMGVLERGIICPTDGNDYMVSPGYHGHIDLALPVYYIQYINIIVKIFKCVCFKCGKLLISKEKYKYFLNLSNEQRWKMVYYYASGGKSKGIMRCGQDTDDGCGYLQPFKITKENLATIYAEWKSAVESQPNVTMSIDPKMAYNKLNKISDEDYIFMGFSPTFGHPKWMVCSVLYVSPPAMRPSIKHDAQQRSEDDITHILVNVIKINDILKEKIANNAKQHIIDEYQQILQYYVAVICDNNIPGSAPIAQRSGRPLKAIKDRLNGKSGRIRGNLMAKRVDFSARSVITADPNLSIQEVGVPMKIAMNITKPVIVNNKNKAFLKQLILNGPDVHPGAVSYEKKNGDPISLKYNVDVNSIVLENGDTVHRHMMDGDPVLFNRQPSLHKMSMMCHKAKVMIKGNTFRLNVAVTKPYNADFDKR